MRLTIKSLQMSFRTLKRLAKEWQTVYLGQGFMVRETLAVECRPLAMQSAVLSEICQLGLAVTWDSVCRQIGHLINFTPCTIGSGAGEIEIDKDGFSGRDSGVQSLREGAPPTTVRLSTGFIDQSPNSYHVDYSYNDNLFSSISTMYNHELAKVSLTLAIAGQITLPLLPRWVAGRKIRENNTENLQINDKSEPFTNHHDWVLVRILCVCKPTTEKICRLCRTSCVILPQRENICKLFLKQAFSNIAAMPYHL